MENTSHTPAPPAYLQRLRATAEVMLSALEGMELPKTFAQAAAAARAVMAISRLMERLYVEPKATAKAAPRKAATVQQSTAPEPIPFTNRKMRRMAEAALRKTG